MDKSCWPINDKKWNSLKNNQKGRCNLELRNWLIGANLLNLEQNKLVSKNHCLWQNKKIVLN